MGVEDKERVSGEVPRSPVQTEPMLPTSHPVAKEPEPPQFTLHPAFYVMYVNDKQGRICCLLDIETLRTTADKFIVQCMDRLQFWSDRFQQVASPLQEIWYALFSNPPLLAVS